MASRFNGKMFGEGSSALDGVRMPRTNVEVQQKSLRKRMSEITKGVLKDISTILRSDGFQIPIVLATSIWAANSIIGCQSRGNREYTLKSACKMDPALGTTSTYKTERDGENFSHAILYPHKKTQPFIVFGDLNKQIQVFQDINGNEIIDGTETVTTFQTPEQANEFLTEQVKKINSGTDR